MANTDLHWSKAHQSHLKTIGEKLENDWLIKNAADAEDETGKMLRKAFQAGFQSGCAASRKLTELGV